jgi:hypothetical protein
MDKFFVSAAAVLGLWLGFLSSAQACKYCRMAADPDTYDATLRGSSSGEARLDAAIDKFSPTMPTSDLSAPPAPASIVTRAADLPPTVVRPVVAVPPAPVPMPMAAAAPIAPAMRSLGVLETHLIDGALAGLAAAGGVFCWRTRRSGGAVR